LEAVRGFLSTKNKLFCLRTTANVLSFSQTQLAKRKALPNVRGRRITKELTELTADVRTDCPEAISKSIDIDKPENKFDKHSSYVL